MTRSRARRSRSFARLSRTSASYPASSENRIELLAERRYRQKMAPSYESRSRAVRRVKRSILVLAPLVFAAVSCGPPQLPPPTGQPSIANGFGNKVVVRLIGQSSSETSDVDAGMAAGRLFLVRKDPDKISWINCGNVIVPYSWRPSDKH